MRTVRSTRPEFWKATDRHNCGDHSQDIAPITRYFPAKRQFGAEGIYRCETRRVTTGCSRRLYRRDGVRDADRPCRSTGPSQAGFDQELVSRWAMGRRTPTGVRRREISRRVLLASVDGRQPLCRAHLELRLCGRQRQQSDTRSTSTRWLRRRNSARSPGTRPTCCTG